MAQPVILKALDDRAVAKSSGDAAMAARHTSALQELALRCRWSLQRTRFGALGPMLGL